jgi:hypothetical protein
MNIELDFTQSEKYKQAKAAIDSPTNEIIVNLFLGALFQYKIFHWQTFSYAQHKAFDGIFESLEDTVDDFVEAFMGKYGRVNSGSGVFSISANNLEGNNFLQFTNNFIDFITNKLPSMLNEKDTDLLNIRDEMLGDLNQLKYLLSLN